MKIFKGIQKFLISKLESHGINLSRNAATTGLTSKQDVIDLLTRLRPQDNGHTLIRVGGSGDGGYLIPDDLLGIAELFSPGSNRLSNFEKEVKNFSSGRCDPQNTIVCDPLTSYF